MLALWRKFNVSIGNPTMLVVAFQFDKKSLNYITLSVSITEIVLATRSSEFVKLTIYYTVDTTSLLICCSLLITY